MTNAWTGGQYSLFRALFGAYLLMYCVLRAHLASPHSPNVFFGTDAHAAARLLYAIGAAASVALAIGMRDRIAAVIVGFAWASSIVPGALFANPGSLFVGVILLGHTLLPARPFGSWDASGRLDPDSGWLMPGSIYTAAWIAMAVGYFYRGAIKLTNPSWIDGGALAQTPDSPFAAWTLLVAELSFAPLACVARIRPWLWLSFLGMNLASILLIGYGHLNGGLILLHFFAFDPGWIRSRHPDGHTTVFYDGRCGLCHRTIRFLLAEDADGLRFRFAPLESESFRSACAEPGSGFHAGEVIPDSVLVQRPGEPMLTRAEGVLEIGHQLGGLWRGMAIAAGVIPLSIMNAVYEFIARIRQRLFARPEEACPLLPAHLRQRFDP